MKKLLCLLVLAFAVSAFAKDPKNIILFIGDGMSMPQRMLAEEYSRTKGSGPLAMNALPYQAMTRTRSANSTVTDSAAAATAIACGVKANNGAIGIAPDGQKVYSCAVAAKESGRKVGICTTVPITHATPAGFYGHRGNRGDSYGLSLDLANSGFDFFAGGGLDYGSGAKNHPEYATCGDGYEYAEKAGYKVIQSKKDFAALRRGCGKIVTKFTHGTLEYAIDLREDANQPTVGEITAKAIEVLDNPKGFFLMVEGGRIDWACHANDPGALLRDMLAFDEAVRIACDFQKRSPDTLIIVTGDHETGGLSLGYTRTGYSIYPERLDGQTMSQGAFEGRVQQKFKENSKMTFDDMKPLLKESFGFLFRGDGVDKHHPMALSSSEEKEVRDAFEHDIALHRHKIGENEKYDGEKRYFFGGTCLSVLSHKAGLGWSSTAHTALPVITNAKGPGAEKFIGFIENTDISRIIKELVSVRGANKNVKK